MLRNSLIDFFLKSELIHVLKQSVVLASVMMTAGNHLPYVIPKAAM